MIEALDDLFDHNEEEQLQKAFDDFFDSSEREPNKEMKMYIMDQKTKWNPLTRIIGKGSVFPEELKGYMFLKKSNIPIKEHRQILTAAHLSYSFDDLAKAMRSQYDGRLARNKCNRHDETDHRRTRRQPAFQAEGDKEAGQEDEGSEDDEDDDEDQSDELLENAMATYLQSKRALMDKKKNRGFFKGDKNESIEGKKSVQNARKMERRITGHTSARTSTVRHRRGHPVGMATTRMARRA